MSVVEPTIDDLLSVTDENRYLLCELASRRARDINDMMRNQRTRAEQIPEVEDVTELLHLKDQPMPNPLSIAFSELAPTVADDGTALAGELTYDHSALYDALGLTETPEYDEVCTQDVDAVAADGLDA